MTKTIERPGMLLPEIDDVTRREFLIGAAGLLLLPVGCESGEDEGAASGETRTVEHALGTTEVPVNPERVVAVDSFAIDTMLALGAEPIGVRDQTTIPQYMAQEVEGIESVGDGPNLEAVAALNPDLILTTEGYETNEELSQIAPTIVAAFESSADWKEIHMKFSEALGMEEEGQRVLDDYDARIEEFRQEMGDDLEDTEVSIFRVSAEGYSLYLPDSFPGTVIEDAGLSRPENQRGAGFTEELSRESVEEIEADHAFVWTFGANPGLTEQEQSELDSLRGDPLWERLDVVERGDITYRGDHWIGSGPLAAELVLEDGSRALLNNE